jgi:hypothetical protein
MLEVAEGAAQRGMDLQAQQQQQQQQQEAGCRLPMQA